MKCPNCNCEFEIRWATSEEIKEEPIKGEMREQMNKGYVPSKEGEKNG